MQEPERKILNPIDENPNIFRSYEISYLEGIYYIRPVDEQQNGTGDCIPIEPPCDIVSYKEKVQIQNQRQNPNPDPRLVRPAVTIIQDREEISITIHGTNPVANRRQIKNQGGTIQVYTPNGPNPWGFGGAPRAAFNWHDKRSKEFELPPYGQPHGFDAGTLLCQDQKVNIGGEDLLTNINNFKKSCTSEQEYINGLTALINGGAKPDFVLANTSVEYDDLTVFLDYSFLNSRAVNTRNNYNGHLATLGELKQYVQIVLQTALKAVKEDYDNTPIALEDGEGNRLASTQCEENLIDNPDYGFRGFPYLRNTPLNEAPRNFLRETLRAITKVQQPGTTQVKNKNFTQDDLIQAHQAITYILSNLGRVLLRNDAYCDAAYSANSFAQQSAGFIFTLMSADMAQRIQRPRQDEEVVTAQTYFLIPLQEAIARKLNELYPQAVIPNVQPQQYPDNTIIGRPAVEPLQPEFHDEEDILDAPAPRPQPETIEVEGKNLLDPGMRVNLEQWFRDNDLGELVHDQNKKTLTGKLSNGSQIVMHSNKIMLQKPAGKETFTDQDLEKSVREIAKMLRENYGEGKVPALSVSGTDEQKALMLKILREEGMQIKGTGMADEPAAPRNEAGARPPR